MKPEYSNQTQQNFVIDAYSHAFNQFTGDFDFAPQHKKDRNPYVGAVAPEHRPAKKTHVSQRRPHAALLYIFGETQSPPLYISDIASMYGVSRELIKNDVDYTLKALYNNSPTYIQESYDLDDIISTPVPKPERKPYVPPYQRDRLDPKGDLEKRLKDPGLARLEAQQIMQDLSGPELLSLRTRGIFVDSIFSIQEEAWGKAVSRKSKLAYNILVDAGIIMAERPNIVNGKPKGMYRFVFQQDHARAVALLKEVDPYVS